MLGITVAVGPGWKECGEWAAKAMSKHTGLECFVLQKYPAKLVHPYWAKLWIQSYFPGEDLLFFDADMACQQNWNPQELLTGYDFVWVPSLGERPQMCPQVIGECKGYGLDPERYGNSGMFILKKNCPILWRAQKLHPSCGRWPEQTALSLAIQWSSDIRVKLLPSIYNFVLRKKQHFLSTKFKSAVNLHFIGLQGDTKKLAKIQRGIPCT